MATTWIKSLHLRKGASIIKSLNEQTQYIENPEKTDGGRLIEGYHCSPRCVDEEFALTKSRYEHITGRKEGKRNVIAYHLRQSFKPGEITPDEALKVGYDLAKRFTKGNHAFIIAVHTDRNHIHTHTIFNSTTLDGTRKFKNFLDSSKALRRLSDTICIENGLSIIEKPKLSKGKDLNRLPENNGLNWSEKIKSQLDELIPEVESFDALLTALKSAGYVINENRKKISVMAPGQKRPIRFDTLKGEYTEEAIKSRIATTKPSKSAKKTDAIKPEPNVNLLINIEQKILEGKGGGYTQWAKVFNLKEAAKTLIFLKENGIASFEDLAKKSAVATADFNQLVNEIKDIEAKQKAKQKEISELQKQIGIYAKTRDIYAKYKASGWNNEFFTIHSADIIRHQSAKKYFSEKAPGKLPKMTQLKQDYAKLISERKTLYSDYHKKKNLSRELAIAKANAEQILRIKNIKKTDEKSQTENEKSEAKSVTGNGKNGQDL